MIKLVVSNMIFRRHSQPFETFQFVVMREDELVGRAEMRDISWQPTREEVEQVAETGSVFSPILSMITYGITEFHIAESPTKPDSSVATVLLQHMIRFVSNDPEASQVITIVLPFDVSNETVHAVVEQGFTVERVQPNHTTAYVLILADEMEDAQDET